MVYFGHFLLGVMLPSDFYVFVLPMGVMVGTLVPLVFHYARSEERQKKKVAKLIRTYMRKRREQEKIFAQELERLQVLLRQKSIDKDTYVRLRKLLEMSRAHSYAESRDLMHKRAGINV